MKRATFDTNVYVSAFTYKGPPARCLALAEEGVFNLQLSPAILEETAGILRRKFLLPESDIEEAKSLMLAISQRVAPHIILEVVTRDPDDNRILECSQSSRSDYIVSSDRHLLDLKIYAGARIVKPGEFLAIAQHWTRL